MKRAFLAVALLVGTVVASSLEEHAIRVAVINPVPFHSEIVAGLMQVCVYAHPLALKTR